MLRKKYIIILLFKILNQAIIQTISGSSVKIYAKYANKNNFKLLNFKSNERKQKIYKINKINKNKFNLIKKTK